MKDRCIVHVTDFHIEDPADEKPVEFLRRSYYDEYLKSLIQELRSVIDDTFGKQEWDDKSLEQRVEISILATGDFVHRGAIEHLPHAAVVLKKMAESLNVPRERVLVCPGNHDIDTKAIDEGRPDAARDAFRAFSREFFAIDDSRIARSNDKASLHRVSKGLFALLFDSTVGAEGQDAPGSLTLAEGDVIMGWVKEIVDDNDVLLVASHHPVDMQSAEHTLHDMVVERPVKKRTLTRKGKKTRVVADSVRAWEQRHIWLDGTKFRHRLMAHRDHAPTLWIGGDIHRSLKSRSGPHYCFITGRFGTRVGMVANTDRQAALIGITETHQVWGELFSFTYLGEVEEAVGGGWIRSKYDPGITDSWPSRSSKSVKSATEAVITTLSAESVPASATSIPVAEATSEQLLSQEGLEGGWDGPRKCLVETIDLDLDGRLRAAIARRQLYRLGRYATSDSETSLAWVSIGPLLNDLTLLSDVLDKMLGWLRQQMQTLGVDATDAQLIGLDCWGSIVASQLGVLMPCSTSAYASRGRGAHSSPNERANEVFRQALDKKRLIVLISDVVSSGESLVRIRDELAAIMPAEPRVSWVGLSVICDSVRQRGDSLNFLEAFGTSCGSLRMPALPTEELPDEGTLRTTVSVR